MINTTSTTDFKTCITAIDSWPPMSFFFGSDLRCYESESEDGRLLMCQLMRAVHPWTIVSILHSLQDMAKYFQERHAGIIFTAAPQANKTNVVDNANLNPCSSAELLLRGVTLRGTLAGLIGQFASIPSASRSS